MGTPKGVRNVSKPLASGDKLLIYSDPERIIVQIRRDVPTLEDILAPTFKVAVQLTDEEALALSHELLTAVSSHLHKQLARTENAPFDENSSEPGEERPAPSPPTEPTTKEERE